MFTAGSVLVKSGLKRPVLVLALQFGADVVAFHVSPVVDVKLLARHGKSEVDGV